MYRHTCFGCQHDKPGQRSHMGFGGCLSKYSNDDDFLDNFNEFFVLIFFRKLAAFFHIFCKRALASNGN